MTTCHKCQKEILLSDGCTAMHNDYHSRCFVCDACGQQLRGNRYYIIGGKNYCEIDYRKTLEKCLVCHKTIADLVIHACGRAYHSKCFTCSVCGRCLDGQRYCTDDSKQIHCIADYNAKVLNSLVCNACNKSIIISRESSVNNAIYFDSGYYHTNCFKCGVCSLPLRTKQSGVQKVQKFNDQVLCLKCYAKAKQS